MTTSTLIRRVELHGLTVDVVAPRVFARTLAIVLAGYPEAAAKTHTDIVVSIKRDRQARAWVVSCEERTYSEFSGVSHAARRAEWLIITEAVKRWSRFVHVHAAIVATSHESILLIGRSGSGKSTTSVALAQAGLVLYTDDVALIDRDTLRPVSVPRPIKLDTRSRRLLRKKGLIVRPENRLDESIARPVLPGLAPIDAPGPPLTKAIFFAPERGPQATFRELTQAEAVMRLVLQSASERFDRNGPTDGALSVINAVRSYELTAGDLDATVQAVLDLVAPGKAAVDNRIIAWPDRETALSAD